MQNESSSSPSSANGGGIKKATRWVARMFGYKAENKFARGVWYVFATSAAIATLYLAVALTITIVDELKDIHSDNKYRRMENDPTYLHDYDNQYVSPYVILHDGYPSYLYNTVEGRRTLTGIQWICKSADDSLTIYCQNDKRGYFNMFTGKAVITAQYEKAWVFSEGVAWVMRQGELILINQNGEDVLGKTFPYTESIDSYCFHNGICPMLEHDGRIGFINKKGEWVIKPFLNYANHDDHGFWLGWDSDENYGVFTESGEILLPFEFDYITFHYHDEYIYARKQNHVDQVYDFEGNLVNACNYEGVYQMEYESDEFVYDKDMEEYIRKSESANCRKYMSLDYNYGLMDKDGNIITPPLYSSIIPIAKNRYFCENETGAVILDDKGQECGEKL